jgi:hypothetical protein
MDIAKWQAIKIDKFDKMEEINAARKLRLNRNTQADRANKKVDLIDIDQTYSQCRLF